VSIIYEDDILSNSCLTLTLPYPTLTLILMISLTLNIWTIGESTKEGN